MELEQKLADLQGELKQYFTKAAEEATARGTMLEETRSKISEIQKQVDALDAKMVERTAPAVPEKSFEDELKENDTVARLMRDRKGHAVISMKGEQVSRLLEQKTTISSSAVGAATSGILQIDRTPGITLEARQQLTVRNLLSARPTTMQLIDFVKVNAPLGKASPQTEASAKAENAVTFTTASETVRTIATWIPASKQVMDDWSELSSFLMTSLPFYVNKEEELQLLAGAGSGVDLNGLITQSTAFNTSLLVAAAGWNKIDIVGRAIQQVGAANEIQPTFIVCHPNDWWGMRLTKDSYGRYILGDPQQMVNPTLFGLTVVPTTNITNGTFLLGNGNSESSEIRDRMEMQVEISTEHSDYFTKNLIAIRAEKRLALVVKRPAAYIHGTFTTSP
jgi:HK97 family phage major capsid protein